MPSQITNYQCPACTAPLQYVGSSDKLECEYCGSSYDVAEIEALYADKERAAAEAAKEKEEWDESSLSEDWGQDGDKLKTYSCPSCGAELICEETTVATVCPYCGNPTVVPGNFSGSLKPDFVIPFRLDRETAKEKLKQFYRGKMLLPREFSQENQIDKIQGVYVPFWLYDSQVDVNARFDATRSSCYTSGDYQVTDTKHYLVNRSGRVSFEKVPADASEKMPDAYMEGIEPFDYLELKPFTSAYLPGYLADKYDVSAAECAKRTGDRAIHTALAAMERDVTGYDTCIMTKHSTDLHPGKVHYALLPVYMLSTRWRGKSYLFAMNGQTGKFAGELPICPKKWWGWFAGVAVPMTLIVGSILQFLL